MRVHAGITYRDGAAILRDCLIQVSLCAQQIGHCHYCLNGSLRLLCLGGQGRLGPKAEVSGKIGALPDGTTWV